jgi:hypothetical protein
MFTNLTHVQLPDGTEIEYLIDGRDRRIGKRSMDNWYKVFCIKVPLIPLQN